MSDQELVDFIIKDNIFMTLATSDASGKPWSSPVGFTYDDERNVYWISSKRAQHSENIRTRPQVAVSIFGKIPEGGYSGVYIDGVAEELIDDARIQTGIDLFAAKRPQPPRFVASSPRDVTGDADWRMYQVVPQEIFRRQDSEVNGQAVTVRKKVY